MKLTKKIFFVLTASVVLNAGFAHADIYGGLSADDRAKIDSDQQVAPDPQDVDGSAWPRVIVYQRVKASSEQAASVMFDYALHKVMFGPVMKDGKISKSGITESTPDSANSATTNIHYTMVLQQVLGLGLPPETYTVKDVLSSYGAGNYRIDWTKVDALTLKDTQGSVQFEPLAGGYALIAYTNWISPPRPTLAKLIKSIYVQMVHDTVGSLIGQINAEVASGDQSQLNGQLANLRQALK